MAIERIDPERCIGCGLCVENCQMDVVRMDEGTGKSVVRYPQHCVLGCWCIAECPQTLSPTRIVPIFTSWG
jgi:NAD-dependent dihydropyrimidine dehydrogenase PreA subunit